jgi:hypothetical protein
MRRDARTARRVYMAIRRFAYEDGGLVVLALRVLNRRDAYR